MCSILVMRGVRTDFPLVIATNRDEFFARPTSGPERLLAQPSTVGGRDLKARGTWMGVTREGLFVGVTNHRSLELAMEPSLRSRGELVLHALSLGSTGEVTRYVQALDGRDYNAFNLMWGDARELFVAYGRTHARELSVSEVPMGLHVLPNDRLDSPDFVKVARARELLEPSLQAGEVELTEALKQTLADRQLPALEDVPQLPPRSVLTRELLRELSALCVRTPLYGTRSSTIVMVQPGRVAKFLYADGPPDRTAFVDVLPLYDADA